MQEKGVTVEVKKTPLHYRQERPHRSLRAMVWLLVLAVAGYGGYRYYTWSRAKSAAAAAEKKARSRPTVEPVLAAAARAGDMPEVLRGLGTVTAYNTVTVRSRVDGQLIAIHFREGQFVKKGDLLAEIDPRPFQVQLEQAQGQLARDQAQWKDATVNLERYRTLWKQGIVARQQFDTQQASVGQYDGVIQADTAAIDNAKLQLSYASIAAPISGRIGLRLVDVGNMVHAADPNGLVVITQVQPIAVLFTLPADNLPAVLAKLRGGARLKVDAYDRDDRRRVATGSLLTVDNEIDPTTGTSRLKAVFDNADSALFPNQFVNCRLLLDVKHGAVIVPAPAIQRGPQGTYVYVVRPDHTVKLRNVAVGITEGDRVSIESGIRPGDVVVIDGQDKLQDGTLVSVRTPRNPVRAGRSGA